MYKQNITYPVYPISDADKIAVYSKLRARHTATGLDYFSRLRTSTTLALNGISDGIGEDLLHAATVGRLETDAYMHDVAFNMPLTLASFNILLEDFGEYQKLERSFQYAEVQRVIDDDLRAGGTGRTVLTEAQSKKLVKLEAEATARWNAAEAAAKAAEAAEARAAEAPRSITVDMVKTGDEFEALLLQRVGKKRTVKIIQYRADGWSWEEVSKDIGLPVKTCQNKYFEAVKKLQQGKIDNFLK